MSGVKIHTKEDAFRLFDEAVTALTTTNFIITEKPITDLLRCLVYSDLLRAFVTDCKKGVDYESELAAAVLETESGYAFVLPKSNKRIIALVTGLLHDFDIGARSLTSFIQTFWPNVDNNTRYRLFCENVLLPYRKAFRQSFLADMDSADQPAEAEAIAKISDSVLESAAPLFTALRTVFAGDNKLSQKKREDLIALTDGLFYALEKGNVKIIKTVWIGLKLALDGNKKAERKFSDISEFLALYALI